MIKVGRICVKLAGRDAGKKCVIIDVLDKNYVLIDGATRRRKCNVNHLLALSDTVEIQKNASHEDVAAALKPLGIEVTTTKPKQKTQRPQKKRKTSEELHAQKEEKLKKRQSSKKEGGKSKKTGGADESLEQKAQPDSSIKPTEPSAEVAAEGAKPSKEKNEQPKKKEVPAKKTKGSKKGSKATKKNKAP